MIITNPHAVTQVPDSSTVPCSTTTLSEKEFITGYSLTNRTLLNKLSQSCLESLYEEFLKKHPSSYDGLHGYAQLLAWSGSYNKALGIYSVILNTYPEDETALFGMVDIYSWSGNFHESLTLIDCILLRNPGSTDAKLRSAKIFSWQTKLDTCIQICMEVLRYDPWNTTAHKIIADTYKWKEEYTSARFHYNILALQESDSTARLDALAEIAELDYKQGKIKDALKEFEELTQYKASYAKAQKRLDEIKNNYSYTIQYTASHYNEFNYNKKKQTFDAGLQNTTADFTIKKTFSPLIQGKLQYGTNDEKAENFLVIKQPVIYHFTTQNVSCNLFYNRENNYSVYLLYKPVLYHIKQFSTSKITATQTISETDEFFHGGSVGISKSIGNNLRFYSALFLNPFVITNKNTSINTDVGGNLSALIKLNQHLNLNPSFSYNSFSDGNSKQSYECNVSDDRFVFGAHPSLTTCVKTFSMQNPGYFNYAWWSSTSIIFHWIDVLTSLNYSKQLQMPIETRITAHLLIPKPMIIDNLSKAMENVFIESQFSTKPKLILSPWSAVSVKITLSLTNNFYSVYDIGVNHEVIF